MWIGQKTIKSARPGSELGPYGNGDAKSSNMGPSLGPSGGEG